MENGKNIFIVAAIVGAIVGSYLFLKKSTPAQKQPEIVETVIVGTNAEYPPFSFMQDGDVAGLDIDIAKHALERLDKQYEIQDKPFDALIPEVQLGTIHMIAAGMTPTAQREKQVFFTTPHYEGDPLLIISPKIKPINTVDELQNKTVIVNEGFTSDRYVSSLEQPMNVQRFPSISEGFLALNNGRADAFVCAQSSVQHYFERYGKEAFSIVPINDQIETYALVVSKKYPQLFADLNKIINDMIKDGTIEQLKQKWNV